MEPMLKETDSSSDLYPNNVSMIVEDREPGVYTRGTRTDHELDFLWDKERKKKHDHDRFHMGFFATGFLTGVVATLVGGAFFLSGGQQLVARIMPEQQTTLEQQATRASAMRNNAGSSHANHPSSFSLSFLSNLFTRQSKPVADSKSQTTASAPATQPAPNTALETYTVKSGDTLGSIAQHFYQSSGPAALKSLQDANSLKNANSLQLGQKLVIPAKAS